MKKMMIGILLISTSQLFSMVVFDKQQRKVADEFVSIFENDTTKLQYAYAENIGDDRGITAGRAGFTSATGDMLLVIEKYTKLRPNNTLKKYTKELHRLERLRYVDGNIKASASTQNLYGLKQAWQENAKDRCFRKVQDQVVDEEYYFPSLGIAREIGAKLEVTLLALYDTAIMHGLEGKRGLRSIVKQTTLQTGKTPKNGIDEVVWLENFNEIRKEILLEDEYWKDSVVRVEELQDIVASKNFSLQPFKMLIEPYDDEVHFLR